MKVHIDQVDVCWLGLMDYRRAWRLQSRLATAIASGKMNPTLLLLEHPHTYTLGRAGNWSNLLWDQDQLLDRGVGTYQVDRGGDITYHGPGQLIAYPLLPLGKVDAQGHLPGPDYHGYLRHLEQVLINVLAGRGLSAGTRQGLTGVWLHGSFVDDGNSTQPAKIAAIGVKVDANGVSQHGFALNVNPDMSFWQGIIPCGLSQYPVTSMAEQLQYLPDPEELRNEIISQFAVVFNCSTNSVTTQQLLKFDDAGDETTA